MKAIQEIIKSLENMKRAKVEQYVLLASQNMLTVELAADIKVRIKELEIVIAILKRL